MDNVKPLSCCILLLLADLRAGGYAMQIKARHKKLADGKRETVQPVYIDAVLSVVSGS